MALVKVRLADNINRVIFVNPKATIGSTIGTDLKMADGSIATIAKLQALLGIDTIITNTTGNIAHAVLTGLTTGDDHPQYMRKDTLPIDRVQTLAAVKVPVNAAAMVEDYYQLGAGLALTLETGAVMQIGTNPVVQAPILNYVLNPSLALDRETFITNPRIPSNTSVVADGYYQLNPGVALSLENNAVLHIGLESAQQAPILNYVLNPVIAVDRETFITNPRVPANSSVVVDGYYKLNTGVVLSLEDNAVLHIGVDGTTASAASSGGGVSSPLTTKGDIYVYSSINDRLPVGADGTVLSADSTQATGLKWITVSGGTLGNPTALVGLVAVNGVSASGIRADGAPALDQSISPTWTGTHTHNGPVVFNTSITGPVVSVDRQTGVTNPTIPANASCIVDEYYQLGAGVTLTLNAGSTMHIGVDGQQISYGAISGVPTIPTGANPTALVGLTAVNGAAVTFMRSDAAPSLDQSVSPTWTGTHTHNGPVVFNVSVTSPATSTDRQTTVLSTIVPANASCIVDEYYQLGAGVALTLSAGATLHIGVDGVPIDPATSFTWSGRHVYTLSAAAGNLTYPVLFKSEGPGFGFQETDAPADQGWWDVMVNASSFRIRAFKDNGTAIRNILQATRTGSEIADLQLGNATSNNTFSFLGTGAITSSGNVTLTPTTGVALTVTGIAAGQVAIDVQHGIKAPAFAVDRQPNDDIVVPANGVSIVEEYQQLATGKTLTLNSGATLFLGIVAVAQPQPQTFTNQYSQALSVKDRAPFVSPIVQPNMSCTVESDYTLNPGIELTLMRNAILAIRS